MKICKNYSGPIINANWANRRLDSCLHAIWKYRNDEEKETFDQQRKLRCKREIIQQKRRIVQWKLDEMNSLEGRFLNRIDLDIRDDNTAVLQFDLLHGDMWRALEDKTNALVNLDKERTHEIKKYKKGIDENYEQQRREYTIQIGNINRQIDDLKAWILKVRQTMSQYEQQCEKDFEKFMWN